MENLKDIKISKSIILENSYFQKLFLIIFLILVFWHGLWSGAPRSDHIYFLHQIGEYSNFFDIIINSPFWNRTHSAPGDQVLFRPLLYIQLGIFYYFFDYNFFLWQLGNLIIHILVVLVLHSIFLQTTLKKTSYPFFLSLLFGVYYQGSTLVLWNHLGGYISFCLLALLSVYFFIKFSDTKEKKYALFSLGASFLCQFFYELGCVLNFIYAIYFFNNFLKKHNNKKKNLSYTGLFIISGLAYFIFSILHLISLENLVFIENNSVSDSIGFLRVIKNILYYFFTSLFYSLGHILFWLGGLMLPVMYSIVPGPRSTLDAFIIYNDFLLYLNYFFCFLIFYTLKYLKFDYKKLLSQIFLPLLFLLFYTLVIYFGRSLPRGLETNNFNLYYGYIAVLSIFTVVAFSARIKEEDYLIIKKQMFNFDFFKITKFAMIILILFNSYKVFHLTIDYRFNYAFHKQISIDIVKRWMKIYGDKKNTFFLISSDCKGNYKLTHNPSTHLHYRRNTNWKPPANYLDILWPEKSALLNRNYILDNKLPVIKISCK